jgi:hypothetical protein
MEPEKTQSESYRKENARLLESEKPSIKLITKDGLLYTLKLSVIDGYKALH